VFWYSGRIKKSADGKVSKWVDRSAKKRDAVATSSEFAPALTPNVNGRPAIQFQHTGLEAKGVKLGNKFDVFAVLRFTGNVQEPNNRWGASSAFMINAPKKTPTEDHVHGEPGGVGLAVTEGQLRLIAEGREWGTGFPIESGRTYVVRIRRHSATKFSLYVNGRRLPVGQLNADVTESPRVRLKIGMSDAFYYGWEGTIAELVGFDGHLTAKRIRVLTRMLRKKWLTPKERNPIPLPDEPYN